MTERSFFGLLLPIPRATFGHFISRGHAETYQFSMANVHCDGDDQPSLLLPPSPSLPPLLSLPPSPSLPPLLSLPPSPSLPPLLSLSSLLSLPQDVFKIIKGYREFPSFIGDCVKSFRLNLQILVDFQNFVISQSNVVCVGREYLCIHIDISDLLRITKSGYFYFFDLCGRFVQRHKSYELTNDDRFTNNRYSDVVFHNIQYCDGLLFLNNTRANSKIHIYECCNSSTTVIFRKTLDFTRHQITYMRCFSILRVNEVVLTTTNRPPVWDDFEIFVPHDSGKSKFQIHAFNTNGDFLRIIHKEYYCPRMFHVSKKFRTDGSTVDVVHMNTVLCDALSQHVRQDGLKFIECMNRHEPCSISVLSPVDGRCLFKIQTHFSRGCLSMDSTPAGQLVVCSNNGEVGIFQ